MCYECRLTKRDNESIIWPFVKQEAYFEAAGEVVETGLSPKPTPILACITNVFDDYLGVYLGA